MIARVEQQGASTLWQRSAECLGRAGNASRSLAQDSYLAACRAERREGHHDNVTSMASGRVTGFAPVTISRRLAAVSRLFSFRAMRDPGVPSPVPRGPAAGRGAARERAGLLAHPG